MNNKSKKVEGLLAAIQRQVPTQEAAPALVPTEADQPETRRKAPRTASDEPKSRAGKAVQFWVWDQDRQLIREFAAWLAGQGERPSDSQVIRAALRMAKTNSEFLKAYRQIAQMDGRLKQRKTA
jgi:hypothetical protein